MHISVGHFDRTYKANKYEAFERAQNLIFLCKKQFKSLVLLIVKKK